jgi:large subunit ribosomal protein L4
MGESMPELPVLDKKGKKVGKIEFVSDLFNVGSKEALVHQSVRSYLAAMRKGTAATKTRGEVRGGGIKPWRQKGTGRARAGSIRSPLWVGGGTVFGPSPRDYSFNMSKKARKIALRAIVSSKLEEGQLLVVDKFAFTDPRTKEALEILENLKAGDKVTVVIAEDDIATEKSFRNIPGVKTVFLNEVNSYDLLDNDTLIFSSKAFENLKEGLKG